MAWSADGSRILYLCDGDSYPELCVVDLDGRLVHGFTWAGWETAALSPDGSQLAFYGGNGAMLSRIAIDAEHWLEKQVVVEIPDVWVADQAANVGAVPTPATSADCGAGTVVPVPARSPGLVRDCQTLVGLRADLFGSSPTNWGPQVPLAQWHGVVVKGNPPRVRGLDLGNGGMGGFPHGGSLPPAVGDLAFLVWLDLSHNDIGAPDPYQPQTRRTHWGIPPEWGKLRRLEVLDLSGNRIGSVAGYALPREFGNLTRLRELRMRDAGIGGFLPPELGRLRNLEVLDLGENRLRGSIPPEVGRLARLTELNMAGGDLSGRIPGDLGRLVHLRRLDLSRNRLTDGIPSELGNLTALQDLRLDDNRLSGTIPAAFGRLAGLKALNLRGNLLWGGIPEELGQLRNLGRLDLRDNQLSGAIPPALGGLAGVQRLLLDGNRFTGCVPSAVLRLDIESTDLRRLGLPVCEAAQ